MRRLLPFFLACFFLFSSCNTASASGEVSIRHVMTRIQNALGGEETFVAADDDFTETNLDATVTVRERLVSFGSGQEVKEIGLFLLDDRRDAAALKENIQVYLKNEQEAISSLAELYPAEELEARLSLYRNATVGAEGMLVYYLVLNDSDTQKALVALTGRQ